jgi:hypothetical protein
MSGKFVETAKVADAIAWRIRTEELFNRDIGAGGPIIGTIHGSKGREAEFVVAHFSSGWAGEDTDEEARVLYVGATRARTDLRLVKTEPEGVGFIDGRAWRGYHQSKFLVEVGQPDDLDVFASCGGLGANAVQQQTALASNDGGMIPIAAYARPVEGDWHWLLLPNDKDKLSGTRVAQAGLDATLPLGALTPPVVRALLEIAKQRKARAPKGFLFGLYWYDTTTVAIRDDEPRVGTVPSPWRNSRLWLAPVIIGFGLGHTK